MMQTMICRVAWATATLPVAGLLIASSLFICAPAAPVPAAEPAGQPAAQRPGACPANNGGIALPPGFCATVFADNLGHARHLAVATDGVVYVNTWSGIYYPGQPPPPGGFVVALKDSRGAGHADVIRRFGDGVAEGSAGGTGIAIYNGAVYAEQNDKIVRYRLSPKSIAPKGPAEVVVSGLPLGGDHPMHPFIIDAHGNIFVDSGTATNSCQPRNRMPHVPGASPCTELQTRGGIWRFDANRLGQKFSPAQRYATGIRNGEGMSFDNAGRLFVTQHGRDQLGENWPDLYTPAIGQELPADHQTGSTLECERVSFLVVSLEERIYLLGMACPILSKGIDIHTRGLQNCVHLLVVRQRGTVYQRIVGSEIFSLPARRDRRRGRIH